jgi:SAM-dependent methyltransferase
VVVRDEDVIKGQPKQTLGEKWNVNPRPGHWYEASTNFATEHLGIGNGRSCLVVGSPLFEVSALEANGWDVTYMDIRNPPQKPRKFIHCDAMGMTLPDESFDAVSSACVLTHAGTGRYGDGLKLLDGDIKMLQHVARVMKNGSVAALTFGACADIPKMLRSAAHRIYTVAECYRMLEVAGLSVMSMRIWSYEKKDWLEEGMPPTSNTDKPDYISFAVLKKCGS